MGMAKARKREERHSAPPAGFKQEPISDTKLQNSSPTLKEVVGGIVKKPIYNFTKKQKKLVSDVIKSLAEKHRVFDVPLNKRKKQDLEAILYIFSMEPERLARIKIKATKRRCENISYLKFLADLSKVLASLQNKRATANRYANALVERVCKDMGLRTRVTIRNSFVRHVEKHKVYGDMLYKVKNDRVKRDIESIFYALANGNIDKMEIRKTKRRVRNHTYWFLADLKDSFEKIKIRKKRPKIA